MHIFDQYFVAEFWKYQVLNNTIQDYVLTLVVFFALLLVFKIFHRVIIHKLEKLALRTKTEIDDAFIKIVDTIKPPFYAFLAFYFAFQFVETNPFFAKIVNVLLIVFVVYQVINAVHVLIDYIVRKGLHKEGGNDSQAAVEILSIISKIALWAIGFILILSNLGIDVTSLIAGLGIGGIAVALALQNILGDLFSSFAIYFDKPFQIGDFIVVGDKKGIVQKVGIKTTRIKALHGEEIVISNKELTSAQINNYKKMKERRVTFGFGVVYDTPTEKLKKIPNIVKDIITFVESARFDRTHFYEFGDSALLFEVVYYTLAPEYNIHMDNLQEIHFKIKEVFEKEGIAMAYPTRTIYTKLLE